MNEVVIEESREVKEKSGDLEVDLYADLAQSSNQLQSTLEIDELRRVNAIMEADNADLKNHLKCCLEQLSKVIEDKELLEVNANILYNTFVREIERKDKEIQELRCQIMKRNIF